MVVLVSDDDLSYHLFGGVTNLILDSATVFAVSRTKDLQHSLYARVAILNVSRIEWMVMVMSAL